MLDPSFPETYWQINNPETVGKTQPGGRDEVGGAEPLSLLLSRRAGLWGMIHNSWGKARSFSKSRGSLRSSSVDRMEASRPNNRRVCSWTGFPSGLAGKMQELQETQVQSLGWGDPQDEDMATRSSIPAWRTPQTVAWRATAHGVAQSQTWLKWLRTAQHILMDEKNMGKKLLRKRTELRREMEMLIIDRGSGFECLVEKKWDLKKKIYLN